jgi:hypothetical protein
MRVQPPASISAYEYSRVDWKLTVKDSSGKIIGWMEFSSFSNGLLTKKRVDHMVFKLIQREMPYWPELEKVIVDGEDITELVRALEKAPLD